MLFFFNDTAATVIYTLSLHDSLPIYFAPTPTYIQPNPRIISLLERLARKPTIRITILSRSEEHTSELQSLTNLVCRLLLEKKKTCVITVHTKPSHSCRPSDK